MWRIGDIVLDVIKKTYPETGEGNLGIGSTIFAVKPGDGSAREQAASCQRVLGGAANIAIEYATKRYRSNLINWGMIPYLYKGNHEELPFAKGDYKAASTHNVSVTLGVIYNLPSRSGGGAVINY